MKGDPKIAVVTWTDAYFSETLPREINMVRYTCGYLVQNNKRVVRLAMSLDERGPADIMSIPRGMVRDVKIIDAEALRAEAEADEIEPTVEELIDAQRGY